MDSSSWTMFLLSAFVLLVVPGPAVLYIVARSVDQGRRAGLVSVLGITVGTLFHVTAATLGVSTILVTSATAFATLKYVGAAYLVFLGIQKLRSREGETSGDGRTETRLGQVFRAGVLVNLLNPKTALFFFAFLPQFVDPSRGSVSLQIVLLSVTFMVLALVTDGAYALVSGTLGERLQRSRGFVGARRYVTGGTYIALGVAAAVSGVRKHDFP